MPHRNQNIDTKKFTGLISELLLLAILTVSLSSGITLWKIYSINNELNVNSKTAQSFLIEAFLLRRQGKDATQAYKEYNDLMKRNAYLCTEL